MKEKILLEGNRKDVTKFTKKFFDLYMSSEEGNRLSFSESRELSSKEANE